MMRRLRPAIISSVAAVLLTLALHGCGRAESPDTIELWTLALRPTFDDYMESIIKDFEASHDGAEVRWVDVPFDALDRKLIAAAAAGRAPDVVNFSDMTFARFVSLGALVDLDPLLPGAAADIYLDGALGICRIDDGLRALPWYLSTQVVTANVSLLSEGGLTPETLGSDWATLGEQAGAFHDRTGRYLFSQALGVESQIPMMLLSEGLPPFRQGPSGEVQADLTRDEVVGFVSTWVDLYRAGVLPREAATRGFDHLVDLYQTGRVAVINTGPTKLASIRDAAPSVYASTVVLPPVTGRLGRSHIATMVVGVTTQARDPHLAAKLAWFITSPQNQDTFCRIATILPSTPATLDADVFDPPTPEVLASSDGQISLARATTAGALRNAVAFTPALETWPDLRRAFEDGIKRALLDGEDTRAVLLAVENEWARILGAAAPAPYDAIPRPEPVHAGEGGAG
jgi:putative chitobiose transport system substrate-binding protein